MHDNDLPMDDADIPTFGFTVGMARLVIRIAKALVNGDKAPDLTNLDVLSKVQACEDDVHMVLYLLNRRKGHGIRPFLRSVIAELTEVAETGEEQPEAEGGLDGALEFRRLPPAQVPRHIREGCVYVLARGDTVVRYFAFRDSATHPFEDVEGLGGATLALPASGFR
jgi:hypothetical protein